MSINAMGGQETIYLSSENSPRRPLAPLQPVSSPLSRLSHQLKDEKSRANFYQGESATLEKTVAALEKKSERDNTTIKALNTKVSDQEYTIKYQLGRLNEYQEAATEEGKLREESSRLRQDNKDLAKQIHSLRERIADLETAETNAATRAADRAAKMLELEVQNSDLESQLLNAETEKVGFISELEGALAKGELLRKRITDLTDELRAADRCRHEVAQLQDTVSDLHASVNQRPLKDELDLEAQKEQIATLEADLAAAKEHSGKLSRDLKESRAEGEELKSRCQKHATDYSTLEAQLRQSGLQCQEYRLIIDELTTRLTTAVQELTDERSNRQLSEARLTGEVDSLKQLLDQAGEDQRKREESHQMELDRQKSEASVKYEMAVASSSQQIELLSGTLSGVIRERDAARLESTKQSADLTESRDELRDLESRRLQQAAEQSVLEEQFQQSSQAYGHTIEELKSQSSIAAQELLIERSNHQLIQARFTGEISSLKLLIDQAAETLRTQTENHVKELESVKLETGVKYERAMANFTGQVEVLSGALSKVTRELEASIQVSANVSAELNQSREQGWERERCHQQQVSELQERLLQSGLQSQEYGRSLNTLRKAAAQELADEQANRQLSEARSKAEIESLKQLLEQAVDALHKQEQNHVKELEREKLEAAGKHGTTSQLSRIHDNRSEFGSMSLSSGMPRCSSALSQSPSSGADPRHPRSNTVDEHDCLESRPMPRSSARSTARSQAAAPPTPGFSYSGDDLEARRRELAERNKSRLPHLQTEHPLESQTIPWRKSNPRRSISAGPAPHLSTPPKSRKPNRGFFHKVPDVFSELKNAMTPRKREEPSLPKENVKKSETFAIPNTPKNKKAKKG